MPRWALIASALVLFIFLGSQLAIPGLAEREVEERLTENGGRAEVAIGAVPALRLLLGDGEQFEVEASGLELDLDERSEVLERLDGFSVVDVSIADFEAGPFAVETFELHRDDEDAYALTSVGSTSPAALAQYGAEALELPGAGLARFTLGRLLDAPEAEIPFELEMGVASDNGRLRVVSGGGTVAGLPAGPLAQLITAAIVVRL